MRWQDRSADKARDRTLPDEPAWPGECLAGPTLGPSLGVEVVVAADETTDVIEAFGIECDRLTEYLREEFIGADAERADAQIDTRADLGAVMHDDDGGLDGHHRAARAQESFQVAGDIGDLTAPAASTAIGEHTLIYEVAVPVELLERPTVTVDMDTDPSPLDLDRPHTTRPNQEMVEFTTAVGIATHKRPLVRQHAQVRGDLVLGRDAGSLPGELVRMGRIPARPSGHEIAHLAAVTKTLPELPPSPRRRPLSAQPVHSLTVFNESPPLAGDGVFRSLHFINGMIRQLDNTHSHSLTP